MLLTVLLENTAGRADVQTEHGLSLFVETVSCTLLFDMGQTELFAENARILGCAPEKADLAVLSHGHYDHGGGLSRFLEMNRTAPVYLSPYAFEPHYNGTQKYIGLDRSLQHHPRLVLAADGMKIGEGLTLFSGETMPRRHDKGSFGLTVCENGVFVPDDFRHEQYLLIEENGKRVLLSGCSHRGILDIVDYFEPDVLVGGFHYSKIAPGQELDEAARILESYPTQYYTCHCTGTEQYAFMGK